jgi:hypothetical protein
MSTGDARSNGDGNGGKDNDDNDKSIHNTSAPLDDPLPGDDDPESMFDGLKPVGWTNEALPSKLV